MPGPGKSVLSPKAHSWYPPSRGHSPGSWRGLPLLSGMQSMGQWAYPYRPRKSYHPSTTMAGSLKDPLTKALSQVEVGIVPPSIVCLAQVKGTPTSWGLAQIQ